VLPQLDTIFFPSQIFWCLLSFFLLWAVTHWGVLPVFQKTLRRRQRKIEDLMKKAQSLEKKAQDTLEKSQQDFDQALQEMREFKIQLAEKWKNRSEEFYTQEKKKNAEHLKLFQDQVQKMMVIAPDEVYDVAETLAPLIAQKLFPHDDVSHEIRH